MSKEMSESFKQSPYYKDSDYDWANGDERNVYIFEEFTQGEFFYQGKLYIPDGDASSKTPYAWSYCKYQSVYENGELFAGIKLEEIENFGATPQWFQDLAKPIRLYLLLNN